VSEHELTTRAATRLALLLDLVARDPSAITSVRDPNEALDLHVADSLTGLELDVVRAASRIADLGSGAGFPGLVLAIALPRARVSLVDSVERKVAFLRSAVAALALENAHVVHARAEAWPEGIARHDLVTARALAPLAVLLEYASPLLAPGGALVAWKGRRDPSEEADGRAASAILGMSPPRPHELAARSRARHRTLYASAKVASTPNRFPRRPGMARKHPLRAAEGGEESSVAKL
jgi:16S rRNA (guanine527-N7)-methyltransferase